MDQSKKDDKWLQRKRFGNIFSDLPLKSYRNRYGKVIGADVRTTFRRYDCKMLANKDLVDRHATG